MTTTQIIFDKKQKFSYIKSVIKELFGGCQITNVSIWGKEKLHYFKFAFNGEEIHCTYMKHSKIYHNGGKIEKCSILSSDRPNENKTVAFRKIAEKFNCRLWTNDCDENNIEIFINKELK